MRWGWLIVLVLALVLGAKPAAELLADLGRRGRRLTVSTLDARGIVAQRPADLRAEASRTLGRDVDLDAYALARMLRSEAGSRSVEEKIALAWVARNDARELDRDVIETLTLRRDRTMRGLFGQQAAGAGRYATTRDPYEGDLAIAEAVLFGRVPDPTGGAVKFVHEKSFGVQPGTRNFADVLETWSREGMRPVYDVVPGSDLVVFRRKDGVA